MRRLRTKKKGGVGRRQDTYDVGADLTTEDRVLGDHDDEFHGITRRFLEKGTV